MKIIDYEVINIQSHPHSKVEFSPFLNVIRAPSDVGKSVLIRGLRLAIINKATKNIRRRKTDISESIISDRKTTIGRYKSDKINGYTLVQKGKKTKSFKALGKDVPFEVRRALNLNEVNIQQQKDTFFLIDESPGKIAKELNKVSGLSDIDASLKRVNAEITSIKTDIRTTNQSIKSIKIEIDDTEWSIQADVDLKNIEKLHNEITLLDLDIQQTDSLIQSYNHYRNELRSLLPESIITDFNEISSIHDDISAINDQMNDIDVLINSYNKLKLDHDSIEDIDLSYIESLIEEITEIDITIDHVEALTNRQKELQTEFQKAQNDLADVELELAKFPICPTCKRPM